MTELETAMLEALHVGVEMSTVQKQAGMMEPGTNKAEALRKAATLQSQFDALAADAIRRAAAANQGR